MSKVIFNLLSEFTLLTGILALSLSICASTSLAQRAVFDNQFAAALESSAGDSNSLAVSASATAPVGFGPDYTLTKSGNGLVSVTVVNGDEYVACFIMRDGEVVGAGAKKRSSSGTHPSSLQKDCRGYNAGKGPAQANDTIDCN